MSNRVLAHVPVFIVTGTSVLLPNNAIFSISLILILGVKIQFKMNFGVTFIQILVLVFNSGQMVSLK